MGGGLLLEQIGPFRWGEENWWEEREKEKEKKRKRKKRMSESSNFSLEFAVIGSSVLVEARGKVGPRNGSYAWAPKSVGFVKL